MADKYIDTWTHLNDDEVDVRVMYEYSPAEPMIRYPNEKAYPGSDEEINVYSVMYGGYDIVEELGDDEMERLGQLCLENEHEE